MHHPTDRIPHTTTFVTQVVEHWLEREIVYKKRKQNTHTYITYIHIHKHAYIYKYIHTNRHCIHPFIRLSIDTYMHVCTHTFIHTYIHTYIYMYIHSYMYKKYNVCYFI